ncbi:hypothetical protein P3X46_034345 [Hevea brasiliensis]|uniref:Malectin-like domain-containing protein n=1 Tax=Hevea brasiliensis TaxID=3981 RepID=A0ABQ9K947_HEVBR|nr:hypothetical protein P3X46_034345 [Hevea brasiliensis]
MKELMMVLNMILVVLLSISLQAFSQERYTDLRIDCGASNQTPIMNPDGLIVSSWLTDKNFADSGENQLLLYSQNFSTMNSLRYFPDGQKNCYFLPLDLSHLDTRFLIRAGFYYGNYDGLSKPPSFNLEIDGNFWTTVITNSTRAQVCLVRIGDGIPFISSLEATAIFQNAYRLMENETALLLHSRINYGANSTIEQFSHELDWFNRIWKSKEMPQYLNIEFDSMVDGAMTGENDPPWPVMQTAIQAKNISDSICLSVNFSTQTTAVAYFVLYFRDPIVSRYPKNSTAQVEIFIDSQKLGATDVPPYYRTGMLDKLHAVSLYPVQVNGSANVTISPAENSTLAALINAMEVFTVVNMPYSSKAAYSPHLSVAAFFIFLHLLSIIFFCH